jgi:hypothetical protein
VFPDHHLTRPRKRGPTSPQRDPPVFDSSG